MAGRPLKIKLEEEEVIKLAAKMWTAEEIGAHFGVSKEYIWSHFQGAMKAGRNRGTALIRDYQWRRLIKGSDQAMIWMSKQYLGQSDKVESKVETTIVPTEAAKEILDSLSTIEKEKDEWKSQPTLPQ